MRDLRVLLVLLPLLPPVAVGCSSKNGCPPIDVTSTQSCATTADCVGAGFAAFTCVSGICRRACANDQDCSLMELEVGLTQACKDSHSSDKAVSFICEQELCTRGCPDVACNAGETCQAGRCVIAFEGFEGTPGLPLVTLSNIGWNDIPHEKSNDRTKVVYSGRNGCNLGDDLCAGTAAEGTHFLALARTPTPPIGTAQSGNTCRACACCLECRLNPAAGAPDLASCPTGNAPPDYVCADQVPAPCQSMCAMCDQCAMQDQTVGQGLLACEKEAAARGCTACATYDRCINDQRAMRMNCQMANDPCHQYANNPMMCLACIDMSCDGMKGPCTACSDAASCELAHPGSSMCATFRNACTAQGADGCFSTPINRLRTALLEDEQAATSKAVPLDQVMGHVVIQFQYVPFDVLDTWVRVIQGTPRASWPHDPQEVVVQLCSASCEQSMSWSDAKFVDGTPASLPPVSQRANGIVLGGQTSVDWTSGRAIVDVPDAFHTKDFRYRFLPRLDDASRLGVDAIVIRRTAP